MQITPHILTEALARADEHEDDETPEPDHRPVWGVILGSNGIAGAIDVWRGSHYLINCAAAATIADKKNKWDEVQLHPLTGTPSTSEAIRMTALMAESDARI